MVGTRWIIDLAAEYALSDSDLIDQAVALVFEHLAEWRVELRVCEGVFAAAPPHRSLCPDGPEAPAA
jgi:hypothetical protein